ncbi:hypothetical protein JHK85_053288 [Glycine max]|nr:hypothetical protein JHK85_053288 [Glycine max]
MGWIALALVALLSGWCDGGFNSSPRMRLRSRHSPSHSGSELQVQDEIGLEELSHEYEKDKATYMDEQVKEEFNRQGDDSKKLQVVSNKERIAFGVDIDWNKYEKKLIEGTLQNTESIREQQDIYSREFRTLESGHKKNHLFHKND